MKFSTKEFLIKLNNKWEPLWVAEVERSESRRQGKKMGVGLIGSSAGGASGSDFSSNNLK